MCHDITCCENESLTSRPPSLTAGSRRGRRRSTRGGSPCPVPAAAQPPAAGHHGAAHLDPDDDARLLVQGEDRLVALVALGGVQLAVVLQAVHLDTLHITSR